jgi:hypothetical protein
MNNKRAHLSAKDLRLIIDVLERLDQELESYVDKFIYSYRYDIRCLHDRVVAEYNYMIRPIKPRKKKEKVNENIMVV